MKMPALKLVPCEYRLDGSLNDRTVRIHHTADENGFWYIIRHGYDKKYWRSKEGWVEHTPDQFTTALAAANTFLAWRAETHTFLAESQLANRRFRNKRRGGKVRIQQERASGRFKAVGLRGSGGGLGK